MVVETILFVGVWVGRCRCSGWKIMLEVEVDVGRKEKGCGGLIDGKNAFYVFVPYDLKKSVGRGTRKEGGQLINS